MNLNRILILVLCIVIGNAVDKENMKSYSVKIGILQIPGLPEYMPARIFRRTATIPLLSFKVGPQTLNSNPTMSSNVGTFVKTTSNAKRNKDSITKISSNPEPLTKLEFSSSPLDNKRKFSISTTAIVENSKEEIPEMTDVFTSVSPPLPIDIDTVITTGMLISSVNSSHLSEVDEKKPSITSDQEVIVQDERKGRNLELNLDGKEENDNLNDVEETSTKSNACITEIDVSSTNLEDSQTSVVPHVTEPSTTKAPDLQISGFKIPIHGYLIVAIGCILPIFLATVILTAFGLKRRAYRRADGYSSSIESPDFSIRPRSYS